MRDRANRGNIAAPSPITDSGVAPGEIRELPLSLAHKSRLQITNSLVTFILAFLAIKMKIDNWSDQYWPKQEWKEGEDIGPVTVLPDTYIKIQEYSRGTSLPAPGDILRFDIRLIYNGLPIKAFNNGQRIVEIMNDKQDLVKETWQKLSLSGLGEDGVLNNMRYGARRKIVLPTAYAFAESGLPPYIPSNADVLVDVILLPPVVNNNDV